MTALYDDKKIVSIKAIGGYKFEIVFQDGLKSVADIGEYIHRHPKVFRELIENPELMNEVEIEPAGVGIFWNDLMGIEHTTLWNLTDLAKNKQK